MSQSVVEQFDRVAAAYATSAVHANGPDLPWLVEALRPDPAWRVIDLGTGAGHAALAVAPRVAEVTAVDVTARMLETAERLASERGIANLALSHASVSALPFPNAAFDAAISRFSAHHWPDPALAAHEAARVLRPGAPFVLIDTVSPEDAALDTFVNALEIMRDPSHARDARLSEWRHHLKRARFQVEDVREWPVTLETEDWLARAATVDWRADVCRRLLREAPTAARNALGITPGGARFSLLGALILARRHE